MVEYHFYRLAEMNSSKKKYRFYNIMHYKYNEKGETQHFKSIHSFQCNKSPCLPMPYRDFN